MEYGIEVMLNTSLKVLALLVIGAILGRFREVVIAMFVFGSIRNFAGGYHSKTHLGCFSVMLFVCLCPIPFLGVELHPAGVVWAAVSVYSIYEVIRYAPRNSAVNPIYDSRILKKKRVGSLIVVGAYILFLICFPESSIKWLVALPMFVEAVTISPLFYNKQEK